MQMHEILNPTSFWRPYIDSLPDDVGTPHTWSAEDVALLESDSMIAYIREDVHSMEKIYHRLFPYLSHVSRAVLFC
jgi:hypothetical protein